MDKEQYKDSFKVNRYGKQKLTFKEDSILANEKRKMKTHCPYCGITIHFYAFEKKDRQLCINCHRYVFKDKKTEFNYRVKELLNRKSVENYERNNSL